MYEVTLNHKCISTCQHFFTNNVLLFVRDAITKIFCQRSLQWDLPMFCAMRYNLRICIRLVGIMLQISFIILF